MDERTQIVSWADLNDDERAVLNVMFDVVTASTEEVAVRSPIDAAPVDRVLRRLEGAELLSKDGDTWTLTDSGYRVADDMQGFGGESETGADERDAPRDPATPSSDLALQADPAPPQGRLPLGFHFWPADMEARVFLRGDGSDGFALWVGAEVQRELEWTPGPTSLLEGISDDATTVCLVPGQGQVRLERPETGDNGTGSVTTPVRNAPDHLISEAGDLSQGEWVGVPFSVYGDALLVSFDGTAHGGRGDLGVWRYAATEWDDFAERDTTPSIPLEMAGRATANAEESVAAGEPPHETRVANYSIGRTRRMARGAIWLSFAAVAISVAAVIVAALS